jgi:hypothetical protein
MLLSMFDDSINVNKNLLIYSHEIHARDSEHMPRISVW